MKRIISFGIILFSAALFICSVHSVADKFIYEDFLVSHEEFSEIINSRETTDKELLLKIRFNNYDLFYDELFSRWYYSVIPENPNLNPAFSFTPTEKNVKIAFSDTAAPGRTISFIAYTDTLMKTYELVVTTLPLVQIENKNIDFSNLDRDATYKIRFKMYDNRSAATDTIVLSEGMLHIRGRGSATFPKKPFRLTLTHNGTGNNPDENQISLLGLRSDGDWLLYPSYNDQERIRNVFSSNLWFESCGNDNSFNIKNGNEYRYIELFFNQQYWGLYAIGYPIDAKQMNISPDSIGEYDEYLFIQANWGPISKDGQLNNVETLIDMREDNLAYGFDYMRKYHASVFDETIDNLWHNDADNAIDIWLYLLLIQADDSISPYRYRQINNVLYTIKMTNDGRKYLYTPWDMDRSWGNNVNDLLKNDTGLYAIDRNDNSYKMILNPVSVMQKNGDEINDKIKDRYHELRNDKWSEQFIDAMLDGFEADIYGSGAYNRDMERWPDSSYQDPASGLSVFKDFVHGRLESMDAYIDGL